MDGIKFSERARTVHAFTGRVFAWPTSGVTACGRGFTTANTVATPEPATVTCRDCRNTLNLRARRSGSLTRY